jgi:serpin B
MQRLLTIFFLFVLVTGFPWMGRAESFQIPEVPEVPDASQTVPSSGGTETAGQGAATAVSAFSIDLYHALRQQQPGNLFVSPYSVSSALAMTQAGANGATADEMAKVLHLPADAHREWQSLAQRMSADTAVTMQTANALWLADNMRFRSDYARLLQERYQATASTVNFSQTTAARDRINKWVEDKTASKIRELIHDIDPDTVIILTNAIYFKGLWSAPFDARNTQQAPFFVDDKTSVSVPMMSNKLRCQFFEDSSVQFVALPYAGLKKRMVILLPAKGEPLAGFEEQLTTDLLRECLDRLKEQEVVVSLPRFKMSSRFELQETLKKMGMVHAFSSQADFTKMFEGGGGGINDVIHQAFVDVNEQGTEAAAATAVIKTKSLSTGRTFRADRPFIFLIQDVDSGAILFIGRVANPAL